MPAALAGVLAVIMIVVFATISRRTADVPPSIVRFPAQPVWIAGGAPADRCVEATAAAAIDTIPPASRLPGSGRHCVSVKPVDVRGPNVRPNIIAFSATPPRINAGQSTRLCYAVSGANLLRIVPRVGTLTRLRACETLVLREPHRYRYLLWATGENGHLATRQLQVEVAAAHTAVAKPAIHLARAAQLGPAVIYQFDATPNVVNSGQATSLCVGVERPARGFVTHVGTLPPGITRCYRVEPRRTTVYRLYVALGTATTVQSVTVVVRPATHRRTVALH